MDENILTFGINGIGGQVELVSHRNASSERHIIMGKRNRQ
jgi:hypothetical protein